MVDRFGLLSFGHRLKRQIDFVTNRSNKIANIFKSFRIIEINKIIEKGYETKFGKYTELEFKKLFSIKLALKITTNAY